MTKPVAHVAASIEAIVEAANCAPSGGNAQPWRWRSVGDRQLCLALDRDRSASLPYLFARLERGQGAGLSAWQINELSRLRERYKTHFELDAEVGEILVFRIARARDVKARSLRRRVNEVLSVA